MVESNFELLALIKKVVKIIRDYSLLTFDRLE